MDLINITMIDSNNLYFNNILEIGIRNNENLPINNNIILYTSIDFYDENILNDFYINNIKFDLIINNNNTIDNIIENINIYMKILKKNGIIKVGDNIIKIKKNIFIIRYKKQITALIIILVILIYNLYTYIL